MELGDIEVKFIDEPTTASERRDVCQVCCSQQSTLSDVPVYLEPIWFSGTVLTLWFLTFASCFVL